MYIVSRYPISKQEVICLHIMGEIAILFSICLAAEGISSLLPFPFPAGVISMILLLFLLLTGIVKERHIARVSQFFLTHLGFFFVAPCIAILNYVDILAACLIPLFVVGLLTIPLVYGATAWTIQLVMAALRRKEERRG